MTKRTVGGPPEESCNEEKEGHVEGIYQLKLLKSVRGTKVIDFFNHVSIVYEKHPKCSGCIDPRIPMRVRVIHFESST